MGSIKNASCPCGFQKSVVVGGSMARFREESYFPYYCATCGLVDVNIAKEDLIACPECQSQSITQYGKPPISGELQERGNFNCYNYKAPYKGNLCPECKQMTLDFLGSEILFD